MKKCLPMLMALLFLLTVLPVGTVMAAMPTTSNFSNVENAVSGRKLTENFSTTTTDDFSDGKYPANVSGSYSQSGDGFTTETTVSQVFSKDKSFAAELYTESGNKMLKLAPSSTGVTVRSWNIPLTDDEVMITQFDLKITQLPTDLKHINAKNKGSNNTTTNQQIQLFPMPDGGSVGMLISMFDGNELKIGGNANSRRCSFSPGNWYTVREELRIVHTFDENGNPTSESFNRTYFILDSNGNVLKNYEENKTNTTTSLNSLYAYVEGKTTSYANKKMQRQFVTVPALTSSNIDKQIEMLVDNFEIVTYKTSEYAPGIKVSSIANNADSVPTSTTSVTITLDQPVAEVPASLNLTCSDSSSMNQVAAVAAATNAAPYTYTVTWENELEKAKTYSLSLSGFKNRGLTNSTDVLTFTTQAPTLEEYTVIENFDAETGYASNGNSYTFPSSIASTHGGASGRKMVKGEGYGNSGFALQSNASTLAGRNNYNNNTSGYNGNNGVFLKKVNEIPANTTLVASYRFRIVQDSQVPSAEDYLSGVTYDKTVRTSIKMGSSSNGIVQFRRMPNDVKGTIYSSNGAVVGYYEEDNWYNVVYAVSAVGEAILLTDATTGDVIYQESLATPGSSSDRAYLFYAPATIKSSVNSGLQVAIDDLTVYTINNSDATNLFKLKETAVAAYNNGELTLNFNQPAIAEANDFSFYLNGSAPENLDALAKVAKISYPDFKQMKVTIKDLAYASYYSVVYSGLTSAGGEGISPVPAAFGFRTGNAATPVTVSGRPALSGLDAGDTLTFTLASSATVKAYAAFYNKSGLIGVEVGSVNDTDAGTITFAKGHEAATSVKLLIWTNDLQPQTDVISVSLPQ